MKSYRHDEKPLKLFGVPFFEETGQLERLTSEIREKIPRLSSHGRRVPGARLCFRTDAEFFTVRIVYEKLELDNGLSMIQGYSGLVFIGERTCSRYAGAVCPKSYSETEAEATFHKRKEMEDVTVYLPRNPVVCSITVTVGDEAKVCEPSPYRYPVPILYYGTSITECGCSMISNGYSSLISRWLDVDFYNMGFSGNALGDLELTEYFSAMEKSIFVYDYDQNAPDAKFLCRTHEPFFREIRRADQNLPIVIMTCPFYKDEEDRKERQQIVMETCRRAWEAGDRNVYFVDMASVYGEENRELCTVDTIHPNDLGSYLIAQKLLPVISEILETSQKE